MSRGESSCRVRVASGWSPVDDRPFEQPRVARSFAFRQAMHRLRADALHKAYLYVIRN